ncbi:arylesterase [Geomobilimonas luticola]|uniref:Arylesterase n=1 Tax=Geomobilimonas luticola TaxID=1114878 RepID=A0ABS5S895_9BACT|nr:arylesterase [Geomobilimonas luticola]MBT0651596.1 arylesterase [Geomobilimonas luticola]
MRILAALVVLVFLAGCPSRPKVPPIPPGGVVLAFGDSITHGTGATPEESYPTVLAREIGFRVVNAGVPGEVTAEGLARLPEVLDRERPALMILCLGGNDIIRHLDSRQTAGNLRAMIRMARERGVSVILVGVPSFGLSMDPPPYYGEIAGEFGIPYDGKSLPRILGTRSLKADTIHPNGTGYRQLAMALTRLLHKSGAF